MIEVESTNGLDQITEFETSLAFALEAGMAINALIAQSTKQADAFWAVREGQKLWQVIPHFINFDTGLGNGKMGEFVDTCRRRLHQQFPDIRVLFFGHAGDGNLHTIADHPCPAKTT